MKVLSNNSLSERVQKAFYYKRIRGIYNRILYNSNGVAIIVGKLNGFFNEVN